MRRLAAALVLVATLAGCPSGATPAKPDAAAAGCTAIGQTCTFSPGKLGTCVAKDDCASPPCLVCQSQH